MIYPLKYGDWWHVSPGAFNFTKGYPSDLPPDELAQFGISLLDLPLDCPRGPRKGEWGRGSRAFSCLRSGALEVAEL